MPMYTFTCPRCEFELERICKIDERDGQTCRRCGCRLWRNIDKPGLVWAPTARNGYAG